MSTSKQLGQLTGLMRKQAQNPQHLELLGEIGEGLEQIREGVPQFLQSFGEGMAQGPPDYGRAIRRMVSGLGDKLQRRRFYHGVPGDELSGYREFFDSTNPAGFPSPRRQEDSWNRYLRRGGEPNRIPLR